MSPRELLVEALLTLVRIHKNNGVHFTVIFLKITWSNQVSYIVKEGERYSQRETGRLLWNECIRSVVSSAGTDHSRRSHDLSFSQSLILLYQMLNHLSYDCSQKSIPTTPNLLFILEILT